MIEGSVDRLNSGLFRIPVDWVQVARYLMATVLAIGIAYGIGLSGGVVTVIAVLFMPALPHSPRLAIWRFLTGVIGFGGGWLVAYQFVDQPWLLLSIVFMNSFFWFYMLATGYPFLNMMILGIMPVLVTWMVYAGAPMRDVAIVLAEYLCGVFASEVVSHLWPNSGEKLLKKNAAAALRSFANQIRSVFGDGRPGKTESGKSVWTAAQSLGFNNLLVRCRAEFGSKQSADYQRLVGLVENIRHIIAWPRMYSFFVRRNHFDKWMMDLMDERNALHHATYRSMDALASAIEGGFAAEEQTELADAWRTLDLKSRHWINENREQISLETIALIEARCHSGEVMVYRVNEIVKFTRGEVTDNDDAEPDLPSATFDGILKKFDLKIATFAFKSMLCLSVGFLVASVYADWGGSLILLLMCGFLAPITVGGLNVMFIDRILGLVLAALIGLFIFLILMPDMVQVGELLFVLSVALVPGYILALKPKTASMGLSYAMGMLFMLTGEKFPGVSLDPIQERLISVAGATSICYLVFRIVLPTTAADLIGMRLKNAFAALADLIGVSGQAGTDKEQMREDRKNARHSAVRALGAFGQLVGDLESESVAVGRMKGLRLNLLETLSSTMLCAGSNSIVTANSAYLSGNAARKQLDKTLASLGDLQRVLSDLVAGSKDYDAFAVQSERVAALMEDEKKVVAEAAIALANESDSPLRKTGRLILTEYAYHRALRHFQQDLYRNVQIHHILIRTESQEAVGRTA